MTLEDLWNAIDQRHRTSRPNCSRSGGCNSSCCVFSESKIQPQLMPAEQRAIEEFLRQSGTSLPAPNSLQCRFLDADALCTIYTVRPTECRLFFCADDEWSSPQPDPSLRPVFDEYFKANPQQMTSEYIAATRFIV